jgi:hypothetical protein
MKDDKLPPVAPELKLRTHVPLEKAKVPLVVVRHKNAEMTEKLQKRWNTKNLGKRLAADAVSAASASVMVAPVVSIIDRSVIHPLRPARRIRPLLASPVLTLVLSAPSWRTLRAGEPSPAA